MGFVGGAVGCAFGCALGYVRLERALANFLEDFFENLQAANLNPAANDFISKKELAQGQ